MLHWFFLMIFFFFFFSLKYCTIDCNSKTLYQEHCQVSGLFMPAHVHFFKIFFPCSFLLLSYINVNWVLCSSHCVLSVSAIVKCFRLTTSWGTWQVFSIYLLLFQYIIIKALFQVILGLVYADWEKGGVCLSVYVHVFHDIESLCDWTTALVSHWDE